MDQVIVSLLILFYLEQLQQGNWFSIENQRQKIQNQHRLQFQFLAEVFYEDIFKHTIEIWDLTIIKIRAQVAKWDFPE